MISKTDMGNNSRTVLNVADGWEFIPRRAGRSWLSGSASEASEQVDLPHSWNRLDTYEEGVVYRQGWGTYRKTFPAFQAREVLETCLLSFGGFYGTGDIWVNGRRRARVDGQYLGARVAIEDPQKPFTVGVRLTNRYASHVLPGIRFPDFLLYGGLAGEAQLIFRSPLHFDADRCFVDYGALGRGELALHWRVRNDGPLSRHVTAFCRVETLQGEIVIPEEAMTSSACEPG
ncbi:MAG: hypothetical protein GWM98_10590, partial [Nitrospinaceae bacterium]|nr:hypothetical protein [Nitrospinaceae bacterium]